MIRALHRWPGLLALVLVTVLALSGAALSVFPALERVSAPKVATDQNVADLTALIAAQHPGIEQIRRAPSGKITAYWFDGDNPGAAVIDPATGLDVASADPNQVERWLTNLHRSLFLDDTGRLVMAGGAIAMLILAMSGAVLVARRMGGWHRWFAQQNGPFAGRLHVGIARLVVPGLVLSALTALWMVASTFDLLPDTTAQLPLPTNVSGQTGLPPDEMAALRAFPVDDLRELSFPFATDAQDVFTITTVGGSGYIDQGTGQLLVWTEKSGWENLAETVYMLHTGQGAAVLGLILGLIALGVPVMAVTGATIWLVGRRGRPHLLDNDRAARAETVVLVGSEGGSTWGFAGTLARALRAKGQAVHVAAMTGFDPVRFQNARRYIILAATYGDGDAPTSAKGFVAGLRALAKAPTAPVAVLGFGDRSFAGYCAFAETVMQAAMNSGWASLLPMDTVNRQSPQDFARWGRALGVVLGIELELSHQSARPATEDLTLTSRRDYGTEVQAPTAILRFELPQGTVWQKLTGQGFGRFQAGDLLGILPEGSDLPRLYSLASGTKDGFVEIVVRKHSGGLCSGQLLDLQPGQTITAFLRRNPGFHMGQDRTPLILIGAGTGVGPLAGFVRANTRHRPVQLYFGMRHPDSDFLYREELTRAQTDERLSRLVTAVSRGARPNYVQDALRLESAAVAEALRHGAKVMVCGGRDMARGVADALTDILAPVGLTPAMLRAEGRYVEDVY